MFITLIIITLAKHNNKLPDDGLRNRNMQEHFNVNFNVSLNIFLEQSSCAYSWVNKRCLIYDIRIICLVTNQNSPNNEATYIVYV
jgi:hypothetical protein